jgi:SET domain-containing protein
MSTRQESPSADRSVEVKASAIEGLGIFALRSFQAGERIRRINVVREITSEFPLRSELGERADHCDYPDGKVILLGSPDCYVNHNCDPNAFQRFDGTDSHLVARKVIALGEEITIDYNVNIVNGTSWPCRCGATRCKGIVTGDFFLLPREWQYEYRPLLADWFVRCNRDNIERLDAEIRSSESE